MRVADAVPDSTRWVKRVATPLKAFAAAESSGAAALVAAVVAALVWCTVSPHGYE